MRPATPDDLEAIAALTAAVDRAQGAEPTYRRNEISLDWGRPGFDLATDSWLVEGDGLPVAYGHVVPRGNTDLVLMIWLHPEEPGSAVAQALVPVMEARARTIAGTSAHDRAIAIASEDEPGLRSVVEKNGFKLDAVFVEMVGDLGGDSGGAPSAPEGIEIRTLQPDETRSFYDVLVTAFSQHWGTGFPPFEEWLRDVEALDGSDSYFSLVALGRAEMVGVLLANLHDGLGEIYDIGVLPQYRGRGIGECLMREIFQRFRKRGGDRARLWVDTKNVTEAVRLYEKVGMSVLRRMYFYAKELTMEGSPAGP